MTWNAVHKIWEGFRQIIAWEPTDRKMFSMLVSELKHKNLITLKWLEKIYHIYTELDWIEFGRSFHEVTNEMQI